MGYKVVDKSRINLIIKQDYNKGYSLQANDTLELNVNYNTSDFIFLKAGTYTYTSLSNKVETAAPNATATIRLNLYNSNKDFITFIQNVTSLNITERRTITFTLENDGYIRVGKRKTETEQMLQEGNTFTGYIPPYQIYQLMDGESNKAYKIGG